MFFYLSKIIWFFLQPSSLILFFLVLGLVLLFFKSKWGLGILTLGVTLYAVAGYSPLANFFLIPLEERIQRSQQFSKSNPPAGILVLGGSIETVTSRGRGQVITNEAAERLSEAVALANLYPDAKLLFSGGEAIMLYSDMTEAAAAKQFFISQGIAPDRLIFENKSRNTWENAVHSKALLKGENPSRWLLVTSAFHMPRALGCFRQAGFALKAWPVDYRTRGVQDYARFFDKPSNGLRRLDRGTREWIGLLAYYFTGKTSAFFPG